jgi:hypothetical protein
VWGGPRFLQVLSNVVAPLLATFDLCEDVLGKYLFIFLEVFYMGPTSFKTSSPEVVFPMRKRVQAPF